MTWLAQVLKAGGLKTGGLAKVKGSDPRKVLLADLLWRRTVVSRQWLAEKRVMKSAVNVSQQLRRLDGMAALKNVPEARKHLLEQADAANSRISFYCQAVAH